MGFTRGSHGRRRWSILSNVLMTALSLLATSTTTTAQDAGGKTAADYFVKSLPGQPDGPLLRMHAGHIEITPEHNGNLFFWHYANRHIADRQRTVIWLNGGPGCSSEDGGLMEIGPYRVKPDGTLRYNDGSWDEFANLLFVDNPVGTGFSYVDGDSYIHELKEMADNFITFLEKFFKLFPQYETDDLYLAGESYAGQHIPYIANHIIERNKGHLLTASAEWNLKGLLIGNGWMSGPEQYRSYTTYAYQAGLIQGGTEGSDKVDATLSRCLDEMNKPGAAERVSISACENVLSKILEVSVQDQQCYNMYDVRLKDSYPSCGMNWPPDLEYVTPYLRRTEVSRALHVNFAKREGWSECNGAVSSAFRALNSTASVSLLPRILEHGIPITLFAGDKDLICNHIGIEDMISNMKWNGGTGFELSPGVWAPKRDWDFEGEPAGIYQEARNLTYIKFYNSSHMVPFDYPRRSRDMLDRFMGVDIASIGGVPADSRLDGVKAGMETSVGGHPNSTVAAEEEKKKLKAAAYKAYYRSGEVALVVVIIAATIWGWWVWRSRRKDGSSGLGNYMTIPAINGSATGLNGHAAGAKGKARDLEAGDFDESELDDLSRNRGTTASGRLEEQEPYDLASDSDDDEAREHDMGDGKKMGHYTDKDGSK